MRSLSRLGLVGLLALAAAPAGAQTTLAWKLAPGEAFDMERGATQEQSVEVRGKAFRQQAESTWRVHLDVVSADGDTRVVRATLKEVQHRLKGSAGAVTEHHLADKLQGRQFTLKVSPRGQVLSLDGYADFVEQAAEKQAERARALRAYLPEDALRAALADLFGPLPEAEVRRGATWRHVVREPVPQFGALRATWH